MLLGSVEDETSPVEGVSVEDTELVESSWLRSYSKLVRLKMLEDCANNGPRNDDCSRSPRSDSLSPLSLTISAFVTLRHARDFRRSLRFGTPEILSNVAITFNFFFFHGIQRGSRFEIVFLFFCFGHSSTSIVKPNSSPLHLTEPFQ